MKLASHGTGGARRRMRWHSRQHRPLRYRGRYGEELAFEVHGDDGRTYALFGQPLEGVPDPLSSRGDAERRAGRTFRVRESFAELRDAALAPNGNEAIGAGRGKGIAAIGDDEPLPCFCTD